MLANAIKRNVSLRDIGSAQTARFKIRSRYFFDFAFMIKIHVTHPKPAIMHNGIEQKGQGNEDREEDDIYSLNWTHTHAHMRVHTDDEYSCLYISQDIYNSQDKSVSSRTCLCLLTSLCEEAAAPQASVTQDIEVVMQLGTVISLLLSTEPSRCSFCLDTASWGWGSTGNPFFLSSWFSPEATFHRVDSEGFLLKANKLQSEYVAMLFKSYSPVWHILRVNVISLILSYTHAHWQTCVLTNTSSLTLNFSTALQLDFNANQSTETALTTYTTCHIPCYFLFTKLSEAAFRSLFSFAFYCTWFCWPLPFWNALFLWLLWHHSLLILFSSFKPPPSSSARPAPFLFAHQLPKPWGSPRVLLSALSHTKHALWVISWASTFLYLQPPSVLWRCPNLYLNWPRLLPWAPDAGVHLLTGHHHLMTHSKLRLNLSQKKPSHSCPNKPLLLLYSLPWFMAPADQKYRG